MVVSGDPKQRIYKRSLFSYRELGLYIEGRKTRNLRTNYRSTKEIMKLASSLQFLDEENDRFDDQRFVREGKKPSIYYFPHAKELNHHLINQVKDIHCRDPGATIAVIHRHDADEHLIHQCPVFRELNRNFDVVTVSQYGKRFDLDKQKKPIFFTDAFSVKDWNLITVEEECGLVGARKLSEYFLWDVDAAIVVDRRGTGDIVTSCGTTQPFCDIRYGQFFEQVAYDAGLTGWKCTAGGSSDTRIWAEQGIQSVNLSAGYEWEHTNDETLDTDACYGTVQLIQAVLNQWQDFSRMLRDVRIANRERVTVMRMQGGKRDVI